MDKERRHGHMALSETWQAWVVGDASGAAKKTGGETALWASACDASDKAVENYDGDYGRNT